MIRIFPSLAILFVMIPCSAHGQSQSPATASQTVPEHAPPATGGKPAKVWTNDDVSALRSNDTVSVVGNTAGTKKTRAASPSPSYEKDPGWYRRQLTPLQAEVANLDSRIATLQEFLRGDNVGKPQPFRIGMPGNPQDQLNQLEKKREADAAKINDLLDRARHNGIEPGALR